MPKVWFIGWLVSMEINLRSEISYTSEATSYKREGWPWWKTYGSKSMRKIMKQTCSLSENCVYLPWNIPLSSVTDEHLPKALIFLFKQPRLAAALVTERNEETILCIITWEMWIIRNKRNNSLNYELSSNALLTAMFRETLISHLDSVQYFLEHFAV